MNIEYRKASYDDEEAVFELAARLATSFAVDRAKFSNIYANLLVDANADLFIAEAESRTIGYVLAIHYFAFYANGLVSRVEEIYVADEYRRKQIGKRLMSLVEQSARERGSELVALATRRAGEFYKSLGYENSAVYYKKVLL